MVTLANGVLEQGLCCTTSQDGPICRPISNASDPVQSHPPSPSHAGGGPPGCCRDLIHSCVTVEKPTFLSIPRPTEKIGRW